MKIWIGPEMEGSRKHIKTMFIKDTALNGNKIMEILNLHKDEILPIKRLYLGAGKLDVTSVYNMQPVYKFCSKNDIEIVTECSLEGYKNLPEELKVYTYIIIRIDAPILKHMSLTDSIKIDTGEAVFIKELEEFSATVLKNCDGEKFSCDKVIHDEDNIKEE